MKRREEERERYHTHTVHNNIREKNIMNIIK